MLSRRRNLILVVLAAALASAGLIFYAWRAAFKIAGEATAPEGAYKSVAFGVFGRLDTPARQIFDGARLAAQTNQPESLLSPAQTEEFLQKRLEVVSSPAPLALSPDELRKKYFSLLYPEVYLSYLRDNQDWLVSEGVLKPEEKVEFKNEDEVFAFLKKLGAYVYSKKIIFTDPAAAFDSEIETLKKLHNGEAEALERGILRPVGPSGFIGKIKFLALKLLGIKTAYAAGECYRDAGPNPIVGANTPTICCDCGIQRIGKIVFPVPDAVGCKTFGGQCNVANFGCLNGAGWGGNAIWDPASKICGYDAGGGFSFLGIIGKIFGVFGIISDLGDFLGGALGDVVEQTVSDLDEIAQAMSGVDPNLAAAIDDLASVEDIVTFDDYFAILDEHEITLTQESFSQSIDAIPTDQLSEGQKWGVVDFETVENELSSRETLGDSMAASELREATAVASVLEGKPPGIAGVAQAEIVENLDLSSVLKDENNTLLSLDENDVKLMEEGSDDLRNYLDVEGPRLFSEGVPQAKLDELREQAALIKNTTGNLADLQEADFPFDPEQDGYQVDADGEPHFLVLDEDISSGPLPPDDQRSGKEILEPELPPPPPEQTPPPPLPKDLVEEQCKNVNADCVHVEKMVKASEAELQNIKDKYGDIIEKECGGGGIVVEHCYAKVAAESKGKADALSPVFLKNRKGEFILDENGNKITSSAGLMQTSLLVAKEREPELFKDVKIIRDSRGEIVQISGAQKGLELLKNPEINVSVGTKEMARLLNHQAIAGDYDKMNAGYNGGLGAIMKSTKNAGCSAAGVASWQCTAYKGYGETRDYVATSNVLVIRQFQGKR